MSAATFNLIFDAFTICASIGLFGVIGVAIYSVIASYFHD
jgi:hypothetical protein